MVCKHFIPKWRYIIFVSTYSHDSAAGLFLCRIGCDYAFRRDTNNNVLYSLYGVGNSVINYNKHCLSNTDFFSGDAHMKSYCFSAFSKCGAYMYIPGIFVKECCQSVLLTVIAAAYCVFLWLTWWSTAMPYCTLDTTLVVIHPWRVYHDIVVVIDGFFCEHLVKKKNFIAVKLWPDKSWWTAACCYAVNV